MSKHVLRSVFLFGVLTCTSVCAQNLCPAGTHADKLICLIPNTFQNGLLLQNNGHENDFGAESFLRSSLTPFDSAISTQSVLRPLASPSSGFTYTWDPSTPTPIRSTESFGPILGERAETVGKHRLFLGFSYEYFKFDGLDGLGLQTDLPAVFANKDVPNVEGRTCSITPPDTANNEGPCGFVRDVIKTRTRFDLKIHQFTTFVTYGLTNHIDISMVIPIEDLRLGVSSKATIVNNSDQSLHVFPDGTLDRSFSNASSASGIGDMTIRVKGTAWKGERAAFALGVDVRLPTGDQLNFLGSGAAGVKPFFVGSYRARLSPHALVGYEVNGSSVLAGDVLTGNKERLPSQLTYSVGADVWVTKRLTAAFDIVGQQVFEAQRISIGKFTELGACGDGFCGECPPGQICKPFEQAVTDDNLSEVTKSYNITNLSLGAKIKLLGDLLITGNVQIKLNDSGLRAKAVPLVGISYTF